MSTKTMDPAAVVAALEWRYAVKKFAEGKAIPAETWQALERSLVLAPSSFGLQPWRFVVVTDPAVKARLKPASWNQNQLVEASHVVVFTIRKNLGAADVERYLNRAAEVRGVPVATMDGYKKIMVGFLAQPKPGFDVDAWSTRQTYIALGQFMTAAAVMGIDTCPLEGINPAAYDEILGLAGGEYKTVVACAAGYRAADDKYASAPKVRYPDQDVVTRV